MSWARSCPGCFVGGQNGKEVDSNDDDVDDDDDG
jgi:hypothetical protein